MIPTIESCHQSLDYVSIYCKNGQIKWAGKQKDWIILHFNNMFLIFANNNIDSCVLI